MERSLGWQALTELTRGKDFSVERVRMDETGVVVEGRFELPALAKLTEEDQAFVVAFLRTHGSIKEMEKVFGISYPSVKNRLHRIVEGLGFTLEERKEESFHEDSAADPLALLERGEISASEAARRLKHKKSK
jgi:hypothetical protein